MDGFVTIDKSSFELKDPDTSDSEASVADSGIFGTDSEILRTDSTLSSPFSSIQKIKKKKYNSK